MARIMAFAGSNSTTSINYKLVTYTASLIEHHELQLLDLSKYPFPTYSEDREEDLGYPDNLEAFLDDIRKSDALLISVNEHNSGPSAYFKNLVDWLSRMDRKFLDGKKVLLMSTSPGKRGGQSSLGQMETVFPRFGADIVATFSLPSFKENFDSVDGISDAGLASAHKEALGKFLDAIS